MTDLYPVKPEFAAKARITREQYLRDYQASIDDPDAFWGQAAERLQEFAIRSLDIRFAGHIGADRYGV